MLNFLTVEFEMSWSIENDEIEVELSFLFNDYSHHSTFMNLVGMETKDSRPQSHRPYLRNSNHVASLLY